MNLSANQQYYLQAMGIDLFCLREKQTETPAEVSGAISHLDIRHADVKNSIWDEFRREVAGCERCVLHKGRTQAVFGVGDTNADWMVIGEAPGAEEDRQGEPFVGRAGKLLNAMLLAIGLQREQVFIANILKCRPPNNRDPRSEEVLACETHLQKQIEWINPKIILAVGRVAAQNLLKVDTPIGRMRGKCYDYPDPRIPVVVTYHPAYLLRSPSEKRKVWMDLKYAMKIYKESL